MIIRREQVKAMDTVPLRIFLDKVEAVAQDEFPGAFDRSGLRDFINDRYHEAVAMRRKTERDIAAYILDKLKTEVNARQQHRML